MGGFCDRHIKNKEKKRKKKNKKGKDKEKMVKMRKRKPESNENRKAQLIARKIQGLINEAQNIGYDTYRNVLEILNLLEIKEIEELLKRHRRLVKKE